MNRILACLLMALPACAVLTPAQAHEGNDYPTAERVQFVEECVSDHPDKGRFEMVHKCSCVVDQFAQHYTFDEFVDMSTAAKASTIAGERGNVVRESPMGQRLNADYKKAMAAAREACFLN